MDRSIGLEYWVRYIRLFLEENGYDGADDNYNNDHENKDYNDNSDNNKINNDDDASNN